MLQSYVIAIVAIVSLMGIWVAVQSAWRKLFPEVQGDDILAVRGGCQGCHCMGKCENDPGIT